MLVLRRDRGARWGVYWGGTHMGVLDMAQSLSPRADLYASDGQWTFRKYSITTLAVEQPVGTPVAWAKSSGFLNPRWDVTTPYGPLTLFRERLGVVGIGSQQIQVGRIVLPGFVTRSVAVEAPPDVHLWVQIFLAWVVLIWNQSSVIAAMA